MSWLTKASQCLAVVLLATACTGNSVAGESQTNVEVVSQLVEETIVPGYENLTAKALAFEANVNRMCAGGVDAATTTFRNLVEAWLVQDAMRIGPAMDRRTMARVDWKPNIEDITALVASQEEEITLDFLSSKVGAGQRGLQVAEYFLYSQDIAKPLDARHCEYLVALAGLVAQEVELLQQDWTDGYEDGPPYGEVVSAAEPDTSVNPLVNDALFLIKSITDTELGKAIGVDGLEANPDAVVDGPAELGWARIQNRLEGVRLVLVGSETNGLDKLMTSETAEALQSQLAKIDETIAGFDTTLSEAVMNEPDRIEDLREELTVLKQILETEVVSQLGVTIGFTDADGDGG